MEPRGLISSIPGYNFLSHYLVLILKKCHVFFCLYFMLIFGVILSTVLLISSESSLHILRKM